MAVQPLTWTDPSLWGDTGLGQSSTPNEGHTISADGQRIVFQSDAANLVPNDNSGTTDVFLYDRGIGRVSLVTVNYQGTASADRGGYEPQITPDDRYVVFRSDSDDLIQTPHINNLFRGQPAIWRRDLLTGTTELVSINLQGTDKNASAAQNPSISDDGRYVVYDTISADQVPNDTNNASDIFLRDMVSHTTTRIDVGPGGVQTNRNSTNPFISGNGTFVLFKSDADNLVNNDNNTAPDIFLYDRVHNSVQLVTADLNNQFSQNGLADFSSQAISADGRYVVFESNATNLVAQDTGSRTNVFVRDTQTHTTRLLSINRAGTAGAAGLHATITPNGQFVAFVSSSTDVASDVPNSNGHANVYLATITPTSITTRLVSNNSAGTNGGNDDSGTGPDPLGVSVGFPQITPDGRYVAFDSQATDLVAGLIDGNQSQGNVAHRRDVFVRDMQTNTTRAVSVTADGTSTGNNGSYTPALSSDGRSVVFATDATNLGFKDGNQAQDIFVHDVVTGATELASRRSPLLPAMQLAPGGGDLAAATPDGRFVAFINSDGDTSGFSTLRPDIYTRFGSANLYVRDQQTGRIQVASVEPDGTQTAGGAIFNTALSVDGRFIAFVAFRNSLDASVTGTSGGVYLRDLNTGITKMISRNTTTGAPNNNIDTFDEVAVSPDGHYVAFTSVATNLINGVTVPSGQANLYLYDRVAGTLRMVSINAGGTASGSPGTTVGTYRPVFSADSSRLIYASASADLVAGVTDTNNKYDVFAYDLTGPNAFQDRLVSVSTTPNTTGNNDSGGGSNEAFAPRISANGQFVVFGSKASNLTGDATNNSAQVFLRDLLQNTTTLVSFNQGNSAGGNGDSTTPQISTDGKKIFFQSLASDLTGLNSGGHSQLYVRDLSGATPATQMVSVNSGGSAGGNDQSGNQRFFNSDDRPLLSPNGRYIIFNSRATDLVPGYVRGTGNTTWDLYVRDLQTGITALVSYNNSGTASANQGTSPNGAAVQFLVTDQGQVLFTSPAGDLVNGDRNVTDDVFGYSIVGAGSISGTLFNDANGNGTQDASEVGIPFWTVYLDANGNHRLDPDEVNVQTDAKGNYRFTGLPAGTYTVAAVLDDGFLRTAPAGLPGTYTVTLTTNTTIVTGMNFGAQLAPADLEVGSVSVPAAAQPGQDVTVSWTVRNVGSTALTGSWQDAVYLSSGPTFDASATLLATVGHTGGLGTDASYIGTTTVTLPALPPGNYYFFIETDRRGQVTNDNNRANNLLAAEFPTALTVPLLPLSTPTTGQFTALGQNRYVQVNVDQGQTLVFSLDSAATDGATELYVSRLHLPTAGNFDFAAVLGGLHETVTIPTTGPGPYYILARGVSGTAATSTFTLTATPASFVLQSVAPNIGGNTGRVTVAVHGTRLTPTTQVQLVSGSTVINAAALDFRDATLLYATFDLTGKAPGTYDVRAVDGSTSATQAKAFPVVSGVTNPIQVTLSTPQAIRNGRQSSVLVEYTNTGNTDVTAPLLELTATNVVLRLEDQSEFSGDYVNSSIQFLGIAPDGPAGVLRPGQRGSVRVFFKTIGGEAGIKVNLQVNPLASTTATIDWASLKNSLGPATIPADAWDAIYANVTRSVGTTAGQYQQTLAADATYLSELGEHTEDVAWLFEFEIQKANTSYTAQTLATVVDDSVPTPGLLLTFQRQFLRSISGRYRLGTLGRGWTDNWDITATTDAQGNVTIDYAGTLRYLANQGNGNFMPMMGDHGVLKLLSGGNYQLTEVDGSITTFNPDGTLNYQQDPNGNRITATYTSGLLTKLTHSSGASLTLTYTSGLLTQLTDSTGHTETYSYDPAGQHLASYTDTYGTTTYTYVTGQGAPSENALASIAFSDNTHRFFIYDTEGRLINQHGDNNQEGQTYSYGSAGGFTITNANNHATTVMPDDVALHDGSYDSYYARG